MILAQRVTYVEETREAKLLSKTPKGPNITIEWGFIFLGPWIESVL
jgi:hypothetical protein